MKVIEDTDYYTEKYVKCLTDKVNEVNAEKEQLNSLVNSCQSEIRRLNNIIQSIEDSLIAKKEEMENTIDYSKYYVEGYDKAIQQTNSSHSGVMLETVKSATIKTCNDILDRIKELKENVN